MCADKRDNEIIFYAGRETVAIVVDALARDRRFRKMYHRFEHVHSGTTFTYNNEAVIGFTLVFMRSFTSASFT